MITEKELEKECSKKVCDICRFEKICNEAVKNYPNTSLCEAINKTIRKKKLKKLLEL